MTLLLPGLAVPAPGRTAAPLPESAAADRSSLRSIAAWLRDSGAEGYLAGEVADAAGIPRAAAEDSLEVSQRGFRSAGVLRVAQLSADEKREFMLFMVQQPEGEVLFYVASVRDGLKRAFVSLPAHNTVMPLAEREARASFERELSYWSARAAGV